MRGLEWVAADEIATVLSPSRIRMRPREIRFDLPEPHPALLTLRTVDDVFVEVGRLDGVGHTKDVPPVLAERVIGLGWAGAVDGLRRLRALPARPLFDVVVSLEGRRNFNRFTLEDAVGEVLAPRLRGRFVSRTQDGSRAAETDVTVRLLVQGQGATVAVRLADRPLHRRAYKQSAGRGSLHPPLAAALVRMSVTGDGPVVVADPFCGDGTIPIETLLAHPEARVVASDLDPARLANARANARWAKAEFGLVRADAGRPPWGRGRVDVVISNPPWNVTVEAGGSLAGSLERFWSTLRESAGSRVCLVADAALDAPGRLRAAGLTLFPHVQRVRVAGRISDIVLAAPGAVAPELPPGLAGWLDRALGTGVVGADDSF
ncbi:methyltransferase [Streptosporangium fragile]|uniref:methyltransferase n=1 Tax=Streptosporangium fragile TaxID=46186 RepID=UPI0031F1551A